ECWIPAFRVANIRETGNGKEGETAAAQVRTVIGSAKTEHIRPDISSIIRGLSVFAHARKADVSVYYKSGGKSERMAHRNELHKRMEIAQAAVASAVANRLSKARHTMKFRLHSAVLDEN